MRCFVAVAIGLGLSCAWSLAAAQSPVPDALTTLTSRSTLVLVPALVRDKSGKLVFTLKADDFTLTDDGVPQKLTLEQDTGGEPLALVVVLEGSPVGSRELAAYPVLAPLIETAVGGVPHTVAVVAFDSAPVVAQEFTPNIDVAAHAIEDLSGDDSGDGKAAILDSLVFAVDMLRKQPPEYRRAILLVSETADRGSHASLDEALRAISDTNTAIYSIGYPSSRADVRQESGKQNGGQPGPAGGCMASNHADDPSTSDHKLEQAYDCLGQLLPPLRLAKLAYLAARDGLTRNTPETVAKLTGGEYFKLTNAKGLEQTMQTISNHIPNRYVLSFQPQAPHSGLHALGLQVKDYAHLEVTARSEYWADTGVAAQPVAPGPH